MLQDSDTCCEKQLRCDAGRKRYAEEELPVVNLALERRHRR